MARTKNTTKCVRPKHKARVAKASLVSKNKKISGRTYKRGEDVDFVELTHKVTCGAYEGYKGKLISKDAEGNVVFLVLMNARGKTMKEAMEIALTFDELQGVNSSDMLSLVNVDDQEEEDSSLLAFEKTEWKCGKCNGLNTNDGSSCNNVLGGKVCGAAKPFDGKILGWGNFFKQSADEKWTCSACILKNDINKVRCIACNAPKPNEESPKAVLSSIREGSTKNDSAGASTDDDKIASLSMEVKNYSISGKGKRRKLDDSP